MKDIKLLIVDDDCDFRDLLRDFFDREPFSILEADCAADAVSAARVSRPDVILLDVMLPGKSGIEACRELKADALTKDITVVFLTAKTGLQNKIQGFLSGANKYLTKPCSPEDIEGAIFGALGVKRPIPQTDRLPALLDSGEYY